MCRRKAAPNYHLTSILTESVWVLHGLFAAAEKGMEKA